MIQVAVVGLLAFQTYLAWVTMTTLAWAQRASSASESYLGEVKDCKVLLLVVRHTLDLAQWEKRTI